MTNKTIIERGASWTLEETRLLLNLWGQDMLLRNETKAKRTKEVYEKISKEFNDNGFERTADQVRTRVFNMIAEYRRIKKDNNPERRKKCVFFDTLDRIYAAQGMNDLQSAMDDFEPELESKKVELEMWSDSEGGRSPDCNESTSTTTNNKSSTNAASTKDSSATSNSTVNANNANNNNDINNGDSNASSDILTISEPNTLSSSHQATSAPSSNKKIRLDSPKSNQSQVSTHNNQQTSASTSSSTNPNAPLEQNQSTSTATAKQSKTSLPTPTPANPPAGSSQNPSGNPSTSSISHRHQSLLMPHATTSGTPAATSTPVKMTTASGSTSTPSYININSTKLPTLIRANQLIGHPNGNDSVNLNGTATRLPTTAAIASHQLYQAPVNTFDVTSSALLIDRMFAHLSRESENMREWIALEKDRIAQDKQRRQQEIEREVRRERALIDTLMRFQDQWLSFITRLDSRVSDNIREPLKIPEIRDPSKTSTQTTSGSDPTFQTTSSSNTASTYSSSSYGDASKRE